MIILSCCSLWIYDYLIHPVPGARFRARRLLPAGGCCRERSPGERGPAARWHGRRVSRTHHCSGLWGWWEAWLPRISQGLFCLGTGGQSQWPLSSGHLGICGHGYGGGVGAWCYRLSQQEEPQEDVTAGPALASQIGKLGLAIKRD